MPRISPRRRNSAPAALELLPASDKPMPRISPRRRNIAPAALELLPAFDKASECRSRVSVVSPLGKKGHPHPHHFVTTEQGIQYTFGSTLAESKFRSHELCLLRQGARNAAATEHSDVCQPGVHKY